MTTNEQRVYVPAYKSADGLWRLYNDIVLPTCVRPQSGRMRTSHMARDDGPWYAYRIELDTGGYDEGGGKYQASGRHVCAFNMHGSVVYESYDMSTTDVTAAVERDHGQVRWVVRLPEVYVDQKAPPWRHVWKHDTHRVRRDREGHIIDNVVVPFDDYARACTAVNAMAGVEDPAAVMCHVRAAVAALEAGDSPRTTDALAALARAMRAVSYWRPR